MTRMAKSAALICLLALAACSPRSLYGTGQAWQRQTCHGIEDVQARSECQKAAGTTFEHYQLTRR